MLELLPASCAYLSILRPGNVHQGFCSRLDNVQELHDGGSVIGDGHLTLDIHHELVHPSGAQGGADGVADGEASIDIGEELTLSLGRISSFFKDDDLGLL